MRQHALATRTALFVAALALILFAWAVARGAETPSTPPTGSAVAGATTAPSALPTVARPSALMIELNAALDLERDRVAALDARVRACTDRRQALALQREIETVKRDTEVSLLRIQATHARRAGRTVLAERLEAAVAELLAPPAVGVPVVRPAPTGR